MPHLVRIIAALALAGATTAQSFVNFDSGPVHAVRASADGSRLFVADTTGDHLIVFDLTTPAAPRLLAEIRVGLDPVSVFPRTRDEVWVTNLMSDSVSIVSVRHRCVIDTLRVVDEPSDVVFANGRAFVTAATRDEVRVFDADTRAALGSVAVFGKDPRALAVSNDGSKVYAVIQRSGNGTTVLPEFFAPPPPPPTNTALPPAPSQGIVIRADDPTWSGLVPFSLPDHDIAEIDTVALTVTRYFDAVGTTNTGIAVHPTTGDLWVTNIEARNLVRFEPALRGHAIDSRVTRVTTGATPTVTPFDLNPGINYTLSPNPQALGTALAEPFGIAIDGAAGRIYVAAQGSDRIGVLDTGGNVLARIEVGGTPGAQVNTRQKRGPRALALHPTQAVLYVLNRLSDTITVIDTTTNGIVTEFAIATVDAMPPALREGRNFLFDSKLSGNGTMSCASCHIDADTDGIAWDLGDPGGVMSNPPTQPFPFNLGLTPMHPMKGPMMTQTLRGLSGVGPLHWRGDRADFHAFNGAFVSLLDGATLAAAEMADFAAYGTTIAFPPNPDQSLDRSLRTTPANNNEAAGLVAFEAPVGTMPLLGQVSCSSCHTLPLTTSGMVISASVLATPLQVKAVQMRNLYRKTGFGGGPGPEKSGYGFTHDGVINALATFVNLPLFLTWPNDTKDDIATFLDAIDSGTAPTVGFQAMLTQANSLTATSNADLALLTARAAAGDIDLVVHGRLDGRIAGLLYQTGSQTFVSDLTGEGPWTLAQLQQKAMQDAALLTFTGVPPGSGVRLAIDRDLDAVTDGDDAPLNYGTPTDGCAGSPTLYGNSEPRLGNSQFAIVAAGAPPLAGGFVVVGPHPWAWSALGVTVYVSPFTSSASFVSTDAYGEYYLPFPVPASPTFLGLPVYAQVGWADPCGPMGFSGSRPTQFHIVP